MPIDNLITLLTPFTPAAVNLLVNVLYNLIATTVYDWGRGVLRWKDKPLTAFEKAWSEVGLPDVDAARDHFASRLGDPDFKRDLERSRRITTTQFESLLESLTSMGLTYDRLPEFLYVFYREMLEDPQRAQIIVIGALFNQVLDKLDQQAQLQQELSDVLTKTREQYKQLRSDEKLAYYLNVCVPKACDDLFRPADAFNFHPRDQFVPISAIWDTGEGEQTSDLVDDIFQKLSRPERQRLAISGNYGQGKTFLVWTLASRLAIKPDRTHIPLIYPLRNYSPVALHHPLQQLEMYLQYHYHRELHVNDLFRTERCLLILDGIDEMPVGVTEVTNVLQRLLRALGGFEKLSVLLTFRTGFFAGGLEDLSRNFPGFHIATLQPWIAGGEAWQTLLRKCEETNYILFPEGWQRFHGQVANTPLLDLTSRPLWCRMILEFRDRILMAGISNEADLYDFYVMEYLKETREKAGANQSITTEQKLYMMQIFAQELVEQNKRYLDDNDLIAAVQNQLHIDAGPFKEFVHRELRTYSLLNAEKFRNSMLYAFGHSSFQDFFYASRLLAAIGSSWPQPSRDLISLLKAIVAYEEARGFAVKLLHSRESERNIILNIFRSDPVKFFGIFSPETTQARKALLQIWIDYHRLAGVIDLTHSRIDQADLSGLDLSNCDLRSASLNGARLNKCNLTNCNLSGAKCRNADFTGATLDGVNWTGADLRGAIGLPSTIL